MHFYIFLRVAFGFALSFERYFALYISGMIILLIRASKCIQGKSLDVEVAHYRQWWLIKHKLFHYQTMFGPKTPITVVVIYSYSHFFTS